MRRIHLPAKTGTFLLSLVVLGALVVHETGALTTRIGPSNPPEALAGAARSAAETAEVRRVATPLTRMATGTVEPARWVALAPRLSAAVLELGVAEGDRVERGQLVARLDDRDLKARLAAASAGEAAARARVEAERAGVARARAEQLRAASELQRTQRLREGGAATERALESARSAEAAAGAAVEASEAAVAAAAASVEAAGQQVEEARVALGWAEVRAPEAGVVASISTEQGELAAPGRPLVTLYDPGTLHLEVALSEAAAAAVAPGARAAVELPALGWSGEAAVTRVHPAADPRSRTVLIELALPAGAPARAGMYGRARFPAGTAERVAVPAAAVMREGQVERVRVVGADGRARARHVRTGARLEGGLLEALSGLTPGERVELAAEPEVGR